VIKHILFDCDGVLIDTEIVAAEEVTQWLRSEGVAIDLETYIAEYTGKTFSDIINLLKSKGQLAKGLDLSEVVPMLDNLIKANQRPIEGVWDMLKSIEVPISSVSNSAKDYVELALDKLEITHHFEGRVYSAEMVAKGKPDPGVYELAVERIGLSKKEIIVVEDSYSGVVAATAADLKTIGFLGGSHVREGLGNKLLSAGALALAHDHSSLTDILKTYI
jgi:HAD superfamily hydrolase (TIGR01509 family)